MAETKSLRVNRVVIAGLIGVLGSGGIVAILFVAGILGLRPLAGGGNPSSPIKVRGGAMTARSKNGWTFKDNSGAHGTSTYCSDTDDVSWIEFFEAKADNGALENPTGLAVGWILKIHGRTYTGPGDGGPSQNGLKIVSQAYNCAHTDAKKVSLLLSIFENDGGSNAQFYGDSATGTDGDGTAAWKFQDMSSGCVGPNGGGTGEEDVCERGATIDFTAADGTKSTYHCTNGECTIYIGK